MAEYPVECGDRPNLYFSIFDECLLTKLDKNCCKLSQSFYRIVSDGGRSPV
ncbi:MAG: hypothetical protein ACFE0J_19425 [Elainellaceae cyanobacterium]